MKEKDLDKILNYMKQYVENKYEHDSEPMLNWKDLKLVLDEIERLNKENAILKQTMCNESLLINENALLKDIIKEAREYIENHNKVIRENKMLGVYGNFMIIPKELLEILNKVNK